MGTAQLVCATLIGLALIGAAVALELTGHDATPAWAALGGSVGTAGALGLTKRATSS